MFRESSPVLFTATEKRAYFKTVTILIPATWTNITIDRVANSEVYEVSSHRMACILAHMLATKFMSVKAA